jgi:hypothetical protein
MLARIGFEGGRGADDVHGLGHSADLQGQIDALAGVDVDRDIGCDGLRKPGRFGGDGVFADPYLREQVITVFIRRRFGLDAGFPG